jgi:DNA-binding NtrC family response regulator
MIGSSAARILIADDDRVVRFVVGQMLSRLGHQVSTAEDGFAARSLFEASPQGFDLVIIDLTMPGMNGSELIAEMRKLNPAQPILITTGHSEHEHIQSLCAEGNIDLLIKPFQFEDLRAWIEARLPEHAASHPGGLSPASAA